MSSSSSSSASGGFSVAAVEKKLKDLNTSIQSIQGVSQWLVHYRKNAKTVVSVWYKEQHKGQRSNIIYIYGTICIIVSFPDPALKEGKGLVYIK